MVKTETIRNYKELHFLSMCEKFTKKCLRGILPSKFLDLFLSVSLRSVLKWAGWTVWDADSTPAISAVQCSSHHGGWPHRVLRHVWRDPFRNWCSSTVSFGLLFSIWGFQDHWEDSLDCRVRHLYAEIFVEMEPAHFADAVLKTCWFLQQFAKYHISLSVNQSYRL